MKSYITTINALLLFLLMIPSHIVAAQKQTPTLVQAKPMSSAKKSSKEWWKNPWVYVASAGLIITTAAATFFGVQVAKTGSKPEPKKTDLKTDKIEAIVEMPSPEEEKELEGLSALALYNQHTEQMSEASSQSRAEFEELVFGFIYDLINNPTYNFDADKTAFNNISREIDQFMQKNYSSIVQIINREETMEAKQTMLKSELAANLRFKIDYFNQLNQLYIHAIESSGNKQIKQALVKFLRNNFIMNTNPAVRPTH